MTLAPEAHREPAGGLSRAPAPVPGLLPRPLDDRRRGWIVTLALTAVAAVLRFWNLEHPTDNGTPVFDEKHYVPQAWQMLRNGGVEDNPGYELVVHPPLGKQFIAIGEWMFGYDAVGWRFSAAVAGTLCVLLIIRIVRRMTRSTMLGAVAGILLICDGTNHVQSRMGMLDIFLAVLVLGAFGCLVVDREQVRERLAVVVAEGRIALYDHGPRLGVRWWRFGAGVLLGMGCATKWAGIYFLLGFAVLSVLWDVSARRAAGVRRPWRGTALRDVGPSFWALVTVPLLVYLASWWAWMRSETAVDRHAVGNQIGEDSVVGFVPDAMRSLWYYSGRVLDFHTNLSTPADPHPWESKPWSWPMGLRPMLYYYESGSGVGGCGRSECVSAVMLVGTPALWWLAPVMLVWAAWRLLTRFDWRYGAVLAVYAVGYLPWFVDIDRQMYFFYMTPLAAFLVIGVTLMLGDILGRARAGRERRDTGLLLVSIYIGLVVANFAWLWPILNADSITPAHWDSELWLPSWR